MVSVNTKSDIENTAKKTIESLYGTDFQEFRIKTVFPYSEDNIAHSSENSYEKGADAWDVQVDFLLNGTKYTVDLMIQQNDGQVTYSRLIDKMIPL
jgi:hypothetical protein